jgi:hypothetical protein
MTERADGTQRQLRRLPWLVAALLGLLLAGAVGVVVLRGRAPGGTASSGTATPGASTNVQPNAQPQPDPVTPDATGSSGASTRPSAGPAPAGPAVVSAKKGVSAWYFRGVTPALRDVRVSWYYTWAPDSGQIQRPPGVEFVPMIWGAKSVTPANLDRVRGQGHALLGFNEPDFSSQANMSVAQALDLWPQLMSTGLRLGSPAPATHAPDPDGWLDRFMAGAAARGYRVDFVAVHWYGADFSARATDQLRGYLDATYQRYHKPIWLTEYALIRFGATVTYPSQAQQADFVRASTAMLERLPYVERYAWFALPAAASGESTGLYRDGPTPTTVGAAYRAAG